MQDKRSKGSGSRLDLGNRFTRRSFSSSSCVREFVPQRSELGRMNFLAIYERIEYFANLEFVLSRHELCAAHQHWNRLVNERELVNANVKLV